MAHRRTSITDALLRLLAQGPQLGPQLHTALIRAHGERVGTSTFYAALASLVEQGLLERPAPIDAAAAAAKITAVAQAIRKGRAHQLALTPAAIGYRLTPAGLRRAQFAQVRQALERSELGAARSSLDALEELCCATADAD